MGRKVILSTCNLNQWALDFTGNYKRILQSIKEAREKNSKYRVGPELEIPGYGCQDHFHELDTFLHSWQVLAKLIVDPECRDIICDVGMPVMHQNVAYNCRIFFFNGKILLIRPKLVLADDDNYRERRYFTAWTKLKQIEDHTVPDFIQKCTDQYTVPFGDAVIQTLDALIGTELCEELWSPLASNLNLALDGVEIISNPSGSHHQLRKVNKRIQLIQNATTKSGGIYLYANQRGCDGDRLYFDGSACIAINGEFVCQGEQFSLNEIEVLTAVLDIEQVRTYRNRIRSLQIQADQSQRYPRVKVNFGLTLDENEELLVPCTKTLEWKYHDAMEEIALGPACWLWDYLRRSKQGGFFLPLSGGIDSCSTACIVYSMCTLIYDELEKKNDKVLQDVRQVVGDLNYTPSSANDLCSKLLVTSYMATTNNSETTKNLARTLASEIGSTHTSIVIDLAVDAILTIWTTTMRVMPRFRVNGGSNNEHMALQNIQARLRMVISYFFAQLTLWSVQRPGSLLVLGSANVDESLRGYFTKYDCSSADLNPIGSISKTDLRSFILYCSDKFKINTLKAIFDAPPTAELTPLDPNGQIEQLDEVDMGMTYEELSCYGKLRKQQNCGPYSMFCKLLESWSDKLTPRQVADKVKHFFVSYSINRHKMTTITPSYFAETYSPDDNRFDHRQFLYPTDWSWQFAHINDKVDILGNANNAYKRKQI